MGRKRTEIARCMRFFGDILETNHACKAHWSRASGNEGAMCILLDAQGTMLALRRVRDLARQGSLEASCSARASQIARALKDVCENELRDMSLEGFHTKRHIASDMSNVEKNHITSRAGKHGGRKEQREGILKDKSNQHPTAIEDCRDAREPALHSNSQDALILGDFIHVPVEGLDGPHKISRLRQDGKLMVNVR